MMWGERQAVAKFGSLVGQPLGKESKTRVLSQPVNAMSVQYQKSIEDVFAGPYSAKA
jgi:hypothetical protein